MSLIPTKIHYILSFENNIQTLHNGPSLSKKGKTLTKVQEKTAKKTPKKRHLQFRKGKFLTHNHFTKI